MVSKNQRRWDLTSSVVEERGELGDKDFLVCDGWRRFANWRMKNVKTCELEITAHG